jgi:predicted transcriptional regulator
MRKAIIRLRQESKAALSEIQARFIQAWRSGEYQGEVFEFESPSALFKLLSPNRWELLEFLQESGPIGIDKIPQRLGRETLQDDVNALLEAGLLEMSGDGKIYFPFAELHADFTLRRAA